MASNLIKVVKFGGSSLASGKQFEKVASIIKSDEARKYVVPSAPGKRFDDDDKVTDLLYKCYDIALSGNDITEAFDKIANRYREIIKDLSLDLSLEKEFEGIKSAFIHHSGRDYAASRGEYLNGIILAKYIGYDFIDAASVIYFCEDGTFDSEKTNNLLSKELRKHSHAVIPGFYGSMPNDTIKTFSRGGSDITGSIVARAASADLYENWTDVSGFLMADPRIVDNPEVIRTITYTELRELSYMGATVLHEEAIFPVRFAGIPINIKNTNKPDDPGTMIVSQTPDIPEHLITGISGKKGFTVITIEKDMMNSELGFGRRVLEVLEKHSISFEHLPSSIDTMSVVISADALKGKRDIVMADICGAVDPESVFIESGLALLAVVGRGMKNVKGTAAKVFKAIAEANISIRTIDQGSSELNIIVGVNENDLDKAMRAIYSEFVEND